MEFVDRLPLNEEKKKQDVQAVSDNSQQYDKKKLFKYSLIQPKVRERYYYKITTANKTIIGNQVMQFIQTKLIEIYLIDRKSSNLLLGYKLHNHDIEGTSMIHYWADDLDDLQSEMTLIIDTKGRLVDIYNFDTLLIKWYRYFVSRLKKKYPNGVDLMIEETTNLLKDKKRYMYLITGGYNIWRFFLQNWYSKGFDKDEQYKLKLHNYWGNVDLDLIVNSKIEPLENTDFIYTIRNTALLDDVNFNKKMFARQMKTLANTYNISTLLNVDMEEVYEFGEDGTLKKSNLFLQTSVSNWYSINNAFQLTQISELDFEKLIQKQRV